MKKLYLQHVKNKQYFFGFSEGQYLFHERVILFFDDDKAGRESIQQIRHEIEKKIESKLEIKSIKL